MAVEEAYASERETDGHDERTERIVTPGGHDDPFLVHRKNASDARRRLSTD
jgi:hypothetical protein